jgi:hypothetical protein
MARSSTWFGVAAALAAGLVATPAVSGAAPQATAFFTDCKAVGGNVRDGYQFIVTCAGRSYSPDRQFSIVQHAYDDKQPPIEVRDARGRTIAKLKSLSDDMPFRVFWARDSRWFFVNHHVGSFMDEMQIFEIVGKSVVERGALVRSSIRAARRRYPCLPPYAVLPNGARWTPDGHRIVMVTISRPDACSKSGRSSADWKPLWMIGDARTGRINPRSIRVARGDGELREPRDAPYAPR